jgi:hypothetical protein
MAVRDIETQARLGRRDLVDVHSVQTIFAQQTKHRLANPTLPQGCRRAHGGQLDVIAIRLLAAITLGVRIARLIFGCGGQRHAREFPVLSTLVMCVPQSAIDIGHRIDAGFLEFRHTLTESILRRKVMRIVVVEGDFVPVIPMKTYRHRAPAKSSTGEHCDGSPLSCPTRAMPHPSGVSGGPSGPGQAPLRLWLTQVR